MTRLPNTFSVNTGPGCSPAAILMRPLPCRSLRLDRNLAANILDITAQEVSHLLDPRAECETIPEFDEIDRRPRRAETL
jgi:hypothetical protein